jgi:hypothetical protein
MWFWLSLLRSVKITTPTQNASYPPNQPLAGFVEVTSPPLDANGFIVNLSSDNSPNTTFKSSSVKIDQGQEFVAFEVTIKNLGTTIITASLGSDSQKCQVTTGGASG